MISLDFWVPGPPYTKGSIECMPNGYPMQSPGSYDYANRVQAAAEAEVARVGWEMATGPLWVGVRFFLPRPNDRDLDVLTESIFPIARGAGDIDKLQRNAFDPLDVKHARVYHDDSQVCQVDAGKFYARTEPDGRRPAWAIEPAPVGTHVAVREILPGVGHLAHANAETVAADAIRRWRGLDGAPVPAGF